MTKEELKAVTAVMLAFAEGKAVEVRYRGDSDVSWQRAPDPSWDLTRFEYRIKPKPREFWVNLYAHGRYLYDTEAFARMNRKNGCETIHVREVLKETAP